MGIYEIFFVTEEIQRMVNERATTAEVREAARKSGMRTLREDGLRKAAVGSTTLSEVLTLTTIDE